MKGSVSAPSTVFAKPASVPDIALIVGCKAPLISIAIAAQFEAAQVIPSVTLVPLVPVTEFCLCWPALAAVPPPET